MAAVEKGDAFESRETRPSARGEDCAELLTSRDVRI